MHILYPIHVNIIHYTVAIILLLTPAQLQCCKKIQKKAARNE